jgi:hypothetical protein
VRIPIYRKLHRILEPTPSRVREKKKSRVLEQFLQRRSFPVQKV